MMIQSRIIVAIAMLLSAVAGCGKTDGSVSVRGTVTYGGKPVPHAKVVFIPESPGVLPLSGLTDTNGHFVLTTAVPGDGASVGKYRVTIEARGPEKVRPPDAPGGVAAGNAEPGEPLIPVQYFIPGMSGLSAEVKSGDNTFDFDLK